MEKISYERSYRARVYAEVESAFPPVHVINEAKKKHQANLGTPCVVMRRARGNHTLYSAIVGPSRDWGCRTRLPNLRSGARGSLIATVHALRKAIELSEGLPINFFHRHKWSSYLQFTVLGEHPHPGLQLPHRAKVNFDLVEEIRAISRNNNITYYDESAATGWARGRLDVGQSGALPFNISYENRTDFPYRQVKNGAFSDSYP